MSRRLRMVGLAASLALALVAAQLHPPMAVQRTLRARLLGPIASLAASWQWVRVHDAMVEGRHGLSLARAEVALDLDPGATSGWDMLAVHQGHWLASELREPDPQRRLAWLRAALETTRRGEQAARDPVSLILRRAVLLQQHGEADDVPWPGGQAAMLMEASRLFDLVASLAAQR